MKRGGYQVTPEFDAVLLAAQNDLWNAWKTAGNFEHRGVRGGEREEAVRGFLRDRLPHAYHVAQGEAVDFRGDHSSQLDLVIYDGQRNCPLLAKTEQILLPVETLLAVVEVKSILTGNDLEASFEAAARLRKLRPFKGKFVGARNRGQQVDEHEYRYFHTVFAYETNLGKEDWLKKEWKRVQDAANKVGANTNLIERIIVLDRGLINTASQTGTITTGNGEDILRQWYVHLINFLIRENTRRPPIDWLDYTYRKEAGWRKL